MDPFTTVQLAGKLGKWLSEKISDSDKASASGPEELRKEAGKQDIELRMAEAQARVAQEVAIATRIERADEVEMEEYYENAGEGFAGGKFDGAAVGVGVGASGRRVTKRIYRFKGFNKNIEL